MEDVTKCADSNCHRKASEMQKKSDKPPKTSAIRQQSLHDKSDKPIPDNNPFYEGLNNPLSSKGN